VVGFPTVTRGPPPLQGDQTSSGTCLISYLVSTVGSPVPGVKELGHDIDHSLLSCAKVNTLWTGHLNCLNRHSRALNTVIPLLYFVSLKIHNKFADD
jgi:hypothetical protein